MGRGSETHLSAWNIKLYNLASIGLSLEASHSGDYASHYMYAMYVTSRVIIIHSPLIYWRTLWIHNIKHLVNHGNELHQKVRI